MRSSGNREVRHAQAVAEAKHRQHEIEIRNFSLATSLSDLFAFEHIRVLDEADAILQSDQQIDDDSIGPAVCKALRRTYRTMAEYARKGWIPPLPSEWHCP